MKILFSKLTNIIYLLDKKYKIPLNNFELFEFKQLNLDPHIFELSLKQKLQQKIWILIYEN